MSAKLMMAALALMGTAPAFASDIKVTTDDRKALSLTVYQGGTAMVRDTRTVRVGAGHNVLWFVDVAARMEPETALLVDPPFEVLERNFDFDLVSAEKLIEKAVGQIVQLHRINPSTGQHTTENAKVLGAGNTIVLEVDGRIEVIGGVVGPTSWLTFDSLPPNLRSRPTLSMSVAAPAANAGNLMLSYLTQGLDWKADYVAHLAPDEKSLSLEGWITVTNTSGTSYDSAELQVVAGDVNRGPERISAVTREAVQGITTVVTQARRQESLFAYHLYTIPTPVTLSENQTKQLALFEARRIAVTRQLTSMQNAGTWLKNSEEDVQHPDVSLKFRNREEDGLGMPLPSGTVRVYKGDSRGQMQFIGEDGMVQVPRNEEAILSLGKDFDVTVRRTQTALKLGYDTPAADAVEGEAVRRRDDRFTRSTSSWKIVVKNGKDEAVKVRVEEQFYGLWRITQESLSHVKEDSSGGVWTVDVPPLGETSFTYTVQVSRP